MNQRYFIDIERKPLRYIYVYVPCLAYAAAAAAAVWQMQWNYMLDFRNSDRIAAIISVCVCVVYITIS